MQSGIDRKTQIRMSLLDKNDSSNNGDNDKQEIDNIVIDSESPFGGDRFYESVFITYQEQVDEFKDEMELARIDTSE